MIVISGAEIASVVGGAGVGWAVNRFARRRPVGPVCQCGHGYVFHDTETTACAYVESKYESRYEIDRNDDGKPIRDSLNEVERTTRTVHVGDVPCTCQTYIRAEHPGRRTRGNP